jgi:capsid protein
MANFFTRTFDRIFGNQPEKVIDGSQVRLQEDIPAEITASSSFKYTPLMTVGYDGEKTVGEIGSIRRYVIDHAALSLRGYQSYLDSDITHDIINKFCMWVVGSGLKVQAEPVEDVIASESFDRRQFSRVIEQRFALYSKSKECHFSGEMNLHTLAFEALKNAWLAGDVLVVNRVVRGMPKVELIEGTRIQTPPQRMLNSAALRQSGIKVINGVELDKNNRHLAYHVRRKNLQWERIPAIGRSTGRRRAWLLYGHRYRIEDVRGIPIITAVMETLAKMERYKEATVGAAEEVSKVALAVEHQLGGTGENPWQNEFSEAIGIAQRMEDIASASTGDGYDNAKKIARSTGKQAFNLPPGAKLTSTKAEVTDGFDKFYMTMFNLLSAAIGPPPEVALGKYDSNFSASRAALKDWEHTIDVNRVKYAGENFYKPFYHLFLRTQAIQGKIPMTPMMMQALEGNDPIMKEAIINCRFIGVGVPHIDPVKEVKAERAKLGPKFADAPLTSLAAATEALNSGDSETNLEKAADELDNLPEQFRQTEEPPAEGGE